MPDQKQVLADIQRFIAELPPSTRDQVGRLAAYIRGIVAGAGPAGSAAVALVGAELAAEE